MQYCNTLLLKVTFLDTGSLLYHSFPSIAIQYEIHNVNSNARFLIKLVKSVISLENQKHTAQPVKSESQANGFYELVLFSNITNIQHDHQKSLILERMILMSQFI